MIPAVLLLLLSIPLQPSTPLQEALDVSDVFEMIPFGDGIWVAKVLPSPAAYAFANSLVIMDEAGVMVVDTQQSPAAARALLGWIRKQTDAPVRWVVNTHAHGDHVWGNQVYADAYPGVSFLAHELARTFMLGETEATRIQQTQSLPQSIQDRRLWLETGRGPDGEALSEENRTAVARSLALREAYLGELSTLRPTPPNVTFREGLTVFVGKRRVELHYLGRAHSPGDIVVWLPEEKFLAVGDLLEEGAIWLEGAWIPGWADVLEKLPAFAPRTLMVSHGGVHEDTALLQWQADFMRALVEAAAQAQGEGWDDATGVERSNLFRFRDLFALVGVEGEAFNGYLLDAMAEARADLTVSGARGTSPEI
jgi:cyclase